MSDTISYDDLNAKCACFIDEFWRDSENLAVERLRKMRPSCNLIDSNSYDFIAWSENVRDISEFLEQAGLFPASTIMEKVGVKEPGANWKHEDNGVYELPDGEYLVWGNNISCWKIYKKTKVIIEVCESKWKNHPSFLKRYY